MSYAPMKRLTRTHYRIKSLSDELFAGVAEAEAIAEAERLECERKFKITAEERKYLGWFEEVPFAPLNIQRTAPLRGLAGNR